MQDVDRILAALARRTQQVFDSVLGEDRHQLLTQRLHQLYGALELARLFGFRHLARGIETQSDTCRRDIEAE
jgi:hypothetical protein